MTILQLVTEAKALGGWYVTATGQIRRNGKRFRECPIAAVYNNRFPECRTGSPGWRYAAKMLEIEPEDRNALAAASDGETGQYHHTRKFLLWQLINEKGVKETC